MPKLSPGETRSATIDFAIHASADETQRLAEQIAAIQGDIKPVLDQEPEKKD